MSAKTNVCLQSKGVLCASLTVLANRLLGFLLTGLLAGALDSARGDDRAAAVSADDWANERLVLQISIDLPKEAISALAKEPREYVRGIVREGTNQFAEVAIHLKGSVGSFRPIDQKPALTLNFSRFQPNRTFHGRTKIHLNNSVEDPTFLNEKLGSLVFAKAGIATPAVQHADVRLNGRRLGLYVLKEGFTRDFLARHFRDSTGNLYDNDTANQTSDDLDPEPSRTGRADLNKLLDLSRIPDPKRRWRELDHLVDIDQFLSFMAIEIMIGHRDGYSLARNNYRLYHDPAADRFVFLPHGMDQLFGRPDFPWRPNIMAGTVAQIVMSTPEGQQRYQDRFGMMVTNIFDVQELTNTVDRLALLLRPFAENSKFQESIDDLKKRIIERKSFLLAELGRPAPKPLQFHNHVASVANWSPVDVPAQGLLNQTNSPDGTPSLHIAAGPVTAASWRSKVLLERGAYRFEARLRTDRVVPLPYGRTKGVRLRVGGNSTNPDGLVGTRPWTETGVEFKIHGDTEEVDLICELRASGGDAWIDRNSIRLVQTQPF